MTGCGDCEPEFDGNNPLYRRALIVVIAINIAMFAVEIVASFVAGSKALQADALDFLGDAVTYTLSLAVLGASLRVRSTAALIKGGSLGLLALWVLGSSIYRVFVAGVPDAALIGGVGTLALAANLTSAAVLIRFRNGDANVRSAWLCTRNDAIGNFAVILAAGGVWATGHAWPDLAVATAMALLFLHSSIGIIRQAWEERWSPEIS